MPAAPVQAPPVTVRAAIKDTLTSCDEYHRLDPVTRRELAQGLVKISATAQSLASEHAQAADALGKPVLARAQNAGTEFSGVAADRVASTTRNILNAVSFPRFVTELITGVFKAMVDSNQQQMHAFVELIRNVAATTDGFADANIGVAGARNWLAERFPGSFVVEGDEADDFDTQQGPLSPEDQAERDASTRLRLKPGGSMPSEGALRTALGIGAEESVPTGDPENLVALARGALAKGRQQMLATMVMLGMQRIVIESGRLHASMRFHIDTRSQAANDRGSTFDERNEAEVGGKFAYGPWGVEAKMKNTIGYVSTERTQTTEEMNTELDLNSSVELVFKTDYLPLERLAGQGAVDRIRVNTLNPNEEMRMAEEDRRNRRQSQVQEDQQRRSQLDSRLGGTPAAAPAATPASRPSPPADTRGTAPGTTPGSTPGGTAGAAPAAGGTRRAQPNAQPAGGGAAGTPAAQPGGTPAASPARPSGASPAAPSGSAPARTGAAPAAR